MARHVCQAWRAANADCCTLDRAAVTSVDQAEWLCMLECSWDAYVFLAAGIQCGSGPLVEWAIAEGADPDEDDCAAAAAAGRLGFLSWLCDGLGIRWNGGQVACAAARAGHAEIVSWARAHDAKGAPFWCEVVCAAAAEGGQLALLQWAQAQDPPYPWGARVCTAAAASGHLAVLQWARAGGCEWVVGPVCLAAAAHGHTAVLQWVIAGGGCHDAEEHGAVVQWATEGGELLRDWDGWDWLSPVGCLCEVAAAHGQLAVLRWARARGYTWGDTCAAAAREGHLAVLAWARAEGCPWDARTSAAAVEGDQFAALRWVAAHGCPLDLETAQEIYHQRWSDAWPGSDEEHECRAALDWIAHRRLMSLIGAALAARA